jgi:hypothetical protein
MNDKPRKQVTDWECDWAGTERHQLRFFRALPLARKIEIVEDMQETARFFIDKAKKRRSKG